MPGAPRPRPMIRTKTGRTLNPNIVKKTSPKGVVSLKKAQGKNTTRAFKKSIRSFDKARVDVALKFSKTQPSRKMALLERGIDARQLRAKGIPVNETLKVFGFEDTARAYGTKRVISEVGGLEKAALLFGDKELARSVGVVEKEQSRSRRIIEKDNVIKVGFMKIVEKYGLEDAYRVFGMKTINDAYGGKSKIMKILGAEEVNRAAQAVFSKIKNYDALQDVREYAKYNGVIETVRYVGLDPTRRALGLSTEQVKILVQELKKYKK